MRLYLMRHALAEDPIEDRPDDLRALTSKGRKRASRVARFLKDHDERPERIFSSPVVRALQTAEIVQSVLEIDNPIAILRALASDGDPAEVIAALAETQLTSVLLVGHEPLLSKLAAGLLTPDVWRYRLSRCMVLAIRLRAAGGARPRFVLDPKDLQVWTHP